MAHWFDGATQGLTYTGINYGTPTALTVSVWINLDDTDSDHTIAITRVGGNGDGFALLFDDSGGGRTNTFTAVVEEIGGSNVVLNGSTDAATVGAWQHVLMTFTPTSLQLWVDGVEDAQSPVTPTSVADAGNETLMHVGVNQSGLTDMDGHLAELAIWNIEQPDSVKLALANRYAPEFFPRGRIFYDKMIRELHDIDGGVVPTVIGSTVSEHPPMIYPSRPHVTPVLTVAAASGRIMSSLVGAGGLAGYGGIAGEGGGLAG